MKFKELELVKYIVLHSSNTRADQDLRAEDITLRHRAAGRLANGYHVIIPRNGDIQLARDMRQQGDHCTVTNACSIGVCLIGGQSEDGREEDNFTPEQRKALYFVLTALEADHPMAEVQPHSAFDVTTACPGFNHRNWGRPN